MSQDLPEYVNGLPNLCGEEHRVTAAMGATEHRPSAPRTGGLNGIRSAFAVALHMHQPLIPAGTDDLKTAPIISNLRYMIEHPETPDAHNAPVFRWCYKRMGELIPQLVGEGLRPRIMLDYSGCLFHGLREMGADDVIESLKPLAQNPEFRDCVEWLGTSWGHAVAPSTPMHDFRLHVRAWQHHFAAIFGLEALSRVRGFSPPEMALPNHPDACYEFVRTLLECGYRWVLVQEHSIERVEDGGKVAQPHVPHRLVARNSRGQSVSIIAIVKTRGSDSKLVGQMQPHAEAKSAGPAKLGSRSIPPLVTQIGDGENGGVVMNEFPPKFLQVMRESSESSCPPMNVSEYLDLLSAAGISPEEFPAVQPLLQKRIWDRFDGGGPEALESALEKLRQEDPKFHVEGGSWSQHISWVRGYENVLTPMQEASEIFAARVTGAGIPTSDPRYRAALFLLLTSQTSCFRYWGQGLWTDFGLELCRRTTELITREFGPNSRAQA
jgi:hypothetical protein